MIRGIRQKKLNVQTYPCATKKPVKQPGVIGLSANEEDEQKTKRTRQCVSYYLLPDTWM